MILSPNEFGGDRSRILPTKQFKLDRKIRIKNLEDYSEKTFSSPKEVAKYLHCHIDTVVRHLTGCYAIPYKEIYLIYWDDVDDFFWYELERKALNMLEDRKAIFGGQRKDTNNDEQ